MPAEAGRPDPSVPFLEACARGELIVQGCNACGHRQFYPRRWCLVCDSTDVAWVPVSGDAELLTFSVVRRAPSAEHKERVPYAVGVVRLAEGPQMMASLVDVDFDALIPGMALRIVPTVEAGPSFAPAGEAAA